MLVPIAVLGLTSSRWRAHGQSTIRNIDKISLQEFHKRLVSFDIESLAAQPGIAHTELFSKIQPEAAKPVGSAMVRVLAIALPFEKLRSLCFVCCELPVLFRAIAMCCSGGVNFLAYAHNISIWSQSAVAELIGLFNDVSMQLRHHITYIVELGGILRTAAASCADLEDGAAAETVRSCHQPVSCSRCRSCDVRRHQSQHDRWLLLRLMLESTRNPFPLFCLTTFDCCSGGYSPPSLAYYMTRGSQIFHKLSRFLHESARIVTGARLVEGSLPTLSYQTLLTEISVTSDPGVSCCLSHVTWTRSADLVFE